MRKIAVVVLTGCMSLLGWIALADEPVIGGGDTKVVDKCPCVADVLSLTGNVSLAFAAVPPDPPPPANRQAPPLPQLVPPPIDAKGFGQITLSAAPVASVQANGDTNAVIIVYSVTVVIPGDTPGHVEAVTIPVAESIGAFASENCAVKSEDVTGEFERRIQFLGHKGMTMQIHGDWFKNPFIFSIEATVTALEGPAGTCDDRKKIKFNVSPRAGQKGPGVIEPVSE